MGAEPEGQRLFFSLHPAGRSRATVPLSGDRGRCGQMTNLKTKGWSGIRRHERARTSLGRRSNVARMRSLANSLAGNPKSSTRPHRSAAARRMARVCSAARMSCLRSIVWTARTRHQADNARRADRTDAPAPCSLGVRPMSIAAALTKDKTRNATPSSRLAGPAGCNFAGPAKTHAEARRRAEARTGPWADRWAARVLCRTQGPRKNSSATYTRAPSPSAAFAHKSIDLLPGRFGRRRKSAVNYKRMRAPPRTIMTVSFEPASDLNALPAPGRRHPARWSSAHR